MPELDELLERSSPRTTRERSGALEESLWQLSDEARAVARSHPHGRRLRWFAGGVAGLLLLGGTTAAAAETPAGQHVVAQLKGSVPQATSVTMRCTQTAAAVPGADASDPAVARAVAAAQTWFDVHPGLENWDTTTLATGAAEAAAGQQLRQQSEALAAAAAAHARLQALKAQSEAGAEAAAADPSGAVQTSLPPVLRASLTLRGIDPNLVTADSEFCNEAGR